MSRVRMLHFLKDWWKFIQIHQYYTMALIANHGPEVFSIWTLLDSGCYLSSEQLDLTNPFKNAGIYSLTLFSLHLILALSCFTLHLWLTGHKASRQLFKVDCGEPLFSLKLHMRLTADIKYKQDYFFVWKPSLSTLSWQTGQWRHRVIHISVQINISA